MALAAPRDVEQPQHCDLTWKQVEDRLLENSLRAPIDTCWAQRVGYGDWACVPLTVHSGARGDDDLLGVDVGKHPQCGTNIARPELVGRVRNGDAAREMDEHVDIRTPVVAPTTREPISIDDVREVIEHVDDVPLRAERRHDV
jgi:hypothetical protein